MSSAAPIAVIGMHRSGTSCLTGLLEDAGVVLGDVQLHNPFNQKGNRESLAVMRLHERVLSDNGCTWDDPPPGDCTWSKARRVELDSILSGYPEERVWAMKDPRSCFTLSAWQEARPGLRLVGTFRHPAAVAASLRHRDPGMEPERAVRLWCRYNRRLVELHRQAGFPLVCFDLSPDDYLTQVGRAFAALCLSPPTARSAFFDASLRHNGPERLDMGEALTLYEDLHRLAGAFTSSSSTAT